MRVYRQKVTLGIFRQATEVTWVLRVKKIFDDAARTQTWNLLIVTPNKATTGLKSRHPAQ